MYNNQNNNKKDKSLKAFCSDAKIFAEIVNGTLFVNCPISPNDLKPADSVETAIMEIKYPWSEPISKNRTKKKS